MSEIWSINSGSSLGTFTEGTFIEVELPLEHRAEISKISGSLPSGLEIIDNTIQGVPSEVARKTSYRFVLRAKRGHRISDRTFNLEIEGADKPEWKTDSGLLPIGKNNTFFILDSSLVDFQLEANDNDIQAGQSLKYFIASGDGELPPGISLSESGRLTGIIDPILGLEKAAADGSYDSSLFDRYPFDFAIRKGGRFDSFFYDSSLTELDLQEYSIETGQGFDSRPYDFYDFKERLPKKLNRYFEFTVSVSDGDTIEKRTFKIFVVGDDYLRADNTLMQVGTGIFTSDNTFLRTPVWLTPSNLGVKRANNFITLFLDVIDTNTIAGSVNYSFEKTNPGVYLIHETNEEVEGYYEISGLLPEDKVNNITVDTQSDFTVISPETESKLPPGTKIDQNSGEIFGRVPYQPAVTKQYKFTVIARRISSQTTEVADSKKTFTVDILGEVDSTINWKTKSKLATIPSNYVSLLRVEAQSTVPNSFILYSIESGDLPPGLTLNYTGEILGKVTSDSFATDSTYEFTVKAQDQFGFSATTRTFQIQVKDKDDKAYSDIYYKPLFKARERERFKQFVTDPEIFDPSLIYRINDPRFGIQKDPKILVYAGLEESELENYVASCAKFSSKKTLKIKDVKKAEAKLPGTKDIVYEVIYFDLYDPYENKTNTRKKIRIKNSEKILVNSLRRTNDFENNPINYISVGSRIYNFNKIYFDYNIPVDTRSDTVYWNVDYKTFLKTRDGNVRPKYEIGSETNLKFDPTPENTITADSNAIKISDSNDITRFLTNISNLREELQKIGLTERNFLPLWMRSAQENTVQELGYTLAVPLAYTRPGNADRILSGIRNSDVDFRQFQFEVDRLLIESSANNSQEQYIVFGNYQFNLA